MEYEQKLLSLCKNQSQQKKCYKNYKKFKIVFDSICMSKYRKKINI